MFAFVYNPRTMKTTVLKKLLWLTFYSLPLIAFAANFTEPRAAAVAPPVLPQQTQNPAPLTKVIIHKYRARPAGEPRERAIPANFQHDASTALAVKAYVQTQAAEHGVNPAVALWIVKHESQFNPRAKGDGEASRGLWQISKIYHPEVSDAAAFSVTSSTEWSLERIRAGKVNEWSTYRFCRTLYQDCPF
jgi:Lysozyme like domain